MTEKEWLRCKDIETMLECLVTMKYPDAEPCNWGEGDRKKRLFLYACLRRIWSHLPDEYRRAFEMLEPEFDAKVNDKIRQEIWLAAERLSVHGTLLFAVGYDDVGLVCYDAARIAAGVDTEGTGEDGGLDPRQQKEQRAQTSLLRDIFGNPFRTISLNRKWLNQTVKALAQGIYNDRTFTDLPILADALEEAGCNSQDILSHLRGPAPHTRGCWALDLVLGKK